MEQKMFFIECKDLGYECGYRAEAKGQRELVEIMKRHVENEHRAKADEDMEKKITSCIKTPPVAPL